MKGVMVKCACGHPVRHIGVKGQQLPAITVCASCKPMDVR